MFTGGVFFLWYTLIMPTPDYHDSKEKLLQALRESYGTGARNFDIAKAILDLKNQEALTRATWVLGFATIAFYLQKFTWA